MSGIGKLATLAVLTILLAVPSARAQETDRAAVALQRAIRVELVDGDLQAAIGLFEEIAERFSAERAVAATALLHLGRCYEKLGEPEARAAYERVVRDYGDQADEARGRLAALDLKQVPPSHTMTVREVMRTGKRRPGDIQDIPGGLFAVSDDGQLFVYTEWTTGDLAVKNLATGEIRSFYGADWTTEFFEDPVFSPDEKHVVYVRYGNVRGEPTRIEVDSIDGGNREVVYDSKETRNMFTYDWSPDGETILLSSQAADRSEFLATLSLTDKTLQRLVTLNWERPRRAQYSPDGRFVAYDSTKGGDSSIYLISADGAQERVLVDSPGQDDSPLWTRDGQFLLFRSSRSGKWDLYALRMQDGQPVGHEVLVKSNLGAETNLRDVTTKGQLFVHELVGGRDIAIAERIDTPVRTVQVKILPKVLTTENKGPSFAPDGQRLAYMAGLPGSGLTIRVTDLEGRILRDIPLERRFGSNGPPLFSPDGTKLGLRVYDSGENQLMVHSAQTGALLKMFSPLEEKGHFFLLGWSRDSRGVYVLLKPAAGGTSLALIDIDTERAVESTVLSPDVRRARLSPSKDYLAMIAATEHELATRLVLRSLEDGSEKLLKEGISISLTWDFDSRHLFYKKGSWGVVENRMYSFSIETEEETVLVDDMQELQLVSVSPDGKYWGLQNGPQDRDSRIWVLENFLPESPAGNGQTAAR